MKEYIMETKDSGMVSRVVCELVRCRDCKFGEPWGVLIGCGTSKGFGITHNPDWFCADGVAKDINVPDKEGRCENDFRTY